MSFQVFGLNYIFSIILSPGSLGIGIFWHIKTHGCGCHPHNPSSQGAVVEGICYCNICCISSVWCLWSQNLQIDMKLCKNMSSKERMARWKDLGFTWNLHIGWRCTVSAIFNLCVCWSFAPLQLVALLLQSPGGESLQVLLKWVPWWRRFSPSVPRAFTSRGNRDFCSAVTTVVFWTNTFPGGLRPQLNEMAAMFDGRGWRVDFEKSAMFAELVSVWNHDQNLISEFFLGVGKRCADVLSRRAECSRHILSDIWIHLMIASQKVLFVRDEQNAH